MLAACVEYGLTVFWVMFLVSSIFNLSIPFHSFFLSSFLPLSGLGPRLANRWEILIFPRTVGNTGNSRETGLEKSSVLLVPDLFLKLKNDLFLDKKRQNQSTKLCISQDFAIHRLTLSPVRIVHT